MAWYHLYVESKKYNKLVNVTRKKQTHRYREQTSGYGGVRGWEVQTTGFKIGSRMYCTTPGR